jgi:hypothetical protein
LAEYSRSPTPAASSPAATRRSRAGDPAGSGGDESEAVLDGGLVVEVDQIPFVEGSESVGLDDAEVHEDVESGWELIAGDGAPSAPLPLPIVAHSPVALAGMDDGYLTHFGKGMLGSRLQELLRLRSAQLDACAPYSVSRTEDSVTEDQVACLVDPQEGTYGRREVLALRFLDRFATDHHQIGDETFRELSTEFVVEEIVELGWLCGQFVGGHRFMHVLDVFGDRPAVVQDEPARS